MSLLLTPLTIRDVSLRNRIVVSPMCEVLEPRRVRERLASRAPGKPGDWRGGTDPDGSLGGDAGRPHQPADLGIYRDDHVEPLARIFHFIEQHGGVPGVQLAHAGRKASTSEPWNGGAPLTTERGGWTPIWAPSAIPFRDDWQTPRAMDRREIAAVVRAFAAAATRVLAAGGKVAEVHAAHGYLLHEFLSPLTNERLDEYGGSFESRARFLFEVVDAIRGVWPERLPLFVRISATDWTDGGWTIEDSVALASRLKTHGVDLIDCSSAATSRTRRSRSGPATRCRSRSVSVATPA